MEELATSYILLLCLGSVFALFLGRFVETKMLRARREWVRLLVIIPQGIAQPLVTHTSHEIDCSTELYKRLHELGTPFTLEAAVHALGEAIHFYILVPRYAEKRTLSLIQSLWKTSSIHHADEYTPWLIDAPVTNEHLAAGYLSLAKPYPLPLKVAKKGDFEPFSGILGALSGLGAVGDGAVVQWVVKRADPRLISDLGTHLNRLEKGEYHASRFVHENFLITPGATEALREKARSPLFAVNCRIIGARAHGNALFVVNEIAKGYTTGSNQGSQYNNFSVTLSRTPQHLIDSFLKHSFEPTQEMVLTGEELATFFHFPGPGTPFPRIRRS